MKRNINKKSKRNLGRRALSLVLSFVMVVCALHIDYIVEDDKSIIAPMTVYAASEADDPTYKHDANNNISVKLEDLTAYSEACQEYHKYHRNDNLTILGSSGDTTVFVAGFKGLGTSTYPFEGTVKIEDNTDFTINLDAPLFNYVFDSVSLNGGNAIKIAREYSSSRSDIEHTTPLLASHIRHDSEHSATSWNLIIDQPSDNADEQSYNLEQFGGIIGSMDEGAELSLAVTMNATENDTASAVITGTGDIGFVCCTMEVNSSLDFTLTSATRGIAGITTSEGNAGGLVGTIKTGAEFTYTGSNAQTDAADIKTSSGYAGGVAGSNSGTATLASSPYVIKQNIEGTAGAGGVYGYYAPSSAATGENAINTDIYTIDCQVNGNGYDGGLFGMLDSIYDLTLTGAAKIKSNHNSGSATGYGGLIGQYKTNALVRTLQIDAVTVETHKVGAATYYGGGIGTVESTNASYVKFDGFTVDKAYDAGSLTFGGLVASADNAFVDANNITVKVDGTFKGGAVVGTTDHGIVRLTGSTTITEAKSSEPGNGEEKQVGQLVGYRNNALVFGGSGWILNRYNGSVAVDDIGTWGEVLRCSSVLTVDDTAHTVTVASPSSSYTSIASVSDFVISALDFQFEPTSMLLFSTTHTDISGSDITIGDDIDLSGTGITGLTRDNDASNNNSNTKCIYSGTISAGDNTIILAIGEPYGAGITSHDVEGRGKIYRHAYNGLVAIANNSAFNNIKFDGKVDVCAKTDVYIGTAAAQAKGTFGASSAETVTYVAEVRDEGTNEVTTPESGLLMTVDGNGKAYAGRLVGYCTANIKNITVSSSTFDGKLTGGNSENATCFSGVIGKIAHASSEGLAWNFNTVSLKGEVSNTATKVQRVSGLISEISGYSSEGDVRTLTLNGVTVDGLKVSGSVNNNSHGGLLGYLWLNTNVAVTSVSLSNEPTVSMTGSGFTAGLVYRATGHWTVTSLDMSGINIIAPNVTQLGMIVNRGVSHDDGKLYSEGTRSAIYLEMLSSSYTLSWGANKSLPASRSSYVFDELCAYSAPDSSYIMKNGNGIVSVSTSGLKMEKTAEDSHSYVAQTTEGKTANPNTRYYYNLNALAPSSTEWSDYQTALSAYEEYEALSTAEKEAYTGEIPTQPTVPNGSDELMSWGVNQYAAKNIKTCFADCFNGTITAQTYDMKEYSWYPVTLNGNLTVNGTFKFYNKEFEICEAESDNVWSALSTGNSATQHFMLHNGLLYDVSGAKKLTVGTTTLCGNAGLTGSGSGMLVCGTVQGSSATGKATVTVNGPVVLDGAYINGIAANTYAPLLINKVGSNTNLTVKNVSTSSAYTSMTASSNPGLLVSSNYPKAASSLIGDVGLESTASGLTVEFSAIKLDGRTTDVTDSTYNTELTTAYGTNRTIFTKATLLNKFMYEAGSSGKYDYKWSEDWKSDNGSYTHAGLGVTYGAEVGYTNSGEYPGKERCYIEAGSGTYTNPVKGNDTAGEYSAFGNFLPYVATAYNSADNTHQLKINHSASTLSGCGTYNDPYVLTAADFNTVADIIKGGTAGTIILPDVASETSANLLAADWDSTGSSHHLYRYDSDEEKFRQFTGSNGTITYSETGYDLDTVRQYLARAYYSIDQNVTLSTSFAGFGSTADDGTRKYYFRGVIDGNEFSITNQSENPLIIYSCGAVIKDVDIVVNKTDGIQLAQNELAEFPNVKAKAYGAVIGQVHGGDNIIDSVSVSFTETTISFPASNNKYGQLIPVGGYIGAIVNGGVYFRGMDSKSAEDIQGLTSTVTSNVAESNMSWMYVNPIIGRVINGFAVTESDAYRPYEDGTRTYKGSGTDNTVTDSNGTVTMVNGNKHYSITDITTSNSIAMLETNGTDGVIEVPNGQALFVMSLIVNSGMSNQSLGYNADNYQVSRWAAYNDIGPDAVNTEGSDYLIAHADLTNSNTTDKRRGYLMNTYSSGNTDISGGTAKSIKLTTKVGNYILPDGYKGIGNIFNSSVNYHMTVSNFDGNGATISQNTTYYYYPGYGTNSTSAVNLALNGISGSTMDANFDRYYQPYLVASDDGRGGLGLFNYITYTTGTATFKNFTMKGNVKTDIIHYSTGEHIPYTTAYLDFDTQNQRRILAGGSLVGCYVGNLKLNSVALDDVYVFSPKNTGGILGYFPLFYDIEINNDIAGLDSDKIIVESGLNAGGLIGKKQEGTFYFDNANKDGNPCSFNITRVASLCISMTEMKSNAKVFYNTGVGGIVGVSRGRTDATAKATLKNFTMGSNTQSALNLVMCENANIYAGGLFGILNRQYLEMDNCTIYNMSVKSQLTAGGIVGQWLTAGGPTKNVDEYTSTISNTKLICNLDDAEISCTGAKKYSGDNIVDDTENMIFCNAGGFIGSAKEDTSQVTIKNSQIEGYKISGPINSGGVIGIWGDDSTKATGSNGMFNHYLLLNNLSVIDCDIEADTTQGYSGGLVGRINSEAGSRRNTYVFSVSGYNILVQDLNYAGSKSGSVCGKMSNYDYSIVKLAGFSRQETESNIKSTIQEVIGAPASDTNIYGNGGYVVFADYDNASNTSVGSGNNKTYPRRNAEFSNIETSGENVVERVAIGSTEIELSYTIIKDNSGNILKVVPNSDNPTTPTEKDAIIPGLSYGEQQIEGSGTRINYIADTLTTLTEVSSVEQLTGSDSSRGFYIINNSLRNNTGNFLTEIGPGKSNSSISVLKAGTSNQSNATIWYFKKTENNKYLVFTYENGHENEEGYERYIKHSSNNSVILDATGTEFVINKITPSYALRPGINNVFQLHSSESSNYCFAYSGNQQGFYFENHTDKNYKDSENNRYNDLLTVYFVPNSTKLVKSTFTTGLSYNGSSIDITSTPTTIDATNDDFEEYNNAISEAGFSGEEYEVYYITQTIRENIYENQDNLSPYVTTSPKGYVSPSQWLTGDGVSDPVYSASAIKNILADISENVTGHYGYAAALTSTAQDTLVSHISNSSKEYNNYSGISNFPILVVDDTNWATITPMINNYLQMLTNTKYSFQTDVNDVYEVGLHKATWNGTGFTVDTGTTSGCLKREKVAGTDYFRMYANDVDTGATPQFTLMDVKFLDPNDNTKVAYHLYVPIYVKKILQFTFTASFASNTDYYSSAYTQNGNTMFENLGNPVTLKFEYTYTRTNADWKDAINGGDSVLTNYYKSLYLSNQTSAWPTGTKLVLVDALNGGRHYYMDTPPAGRYAYLYLYNFYSDEARAQHFAPANLNELMYVTLTQADAENTGRLVLTDSGGTASSLTYTSGGSSVTVPATVKGVDGKYYAYVDKEPDTAPTYYYVSSVTPKNNYKECYYLSIFTPKNASDVSIYHYEVASKESFACKNVGADTDDVWRANKIVTNQTAHLIMGNLYENNLMLNVVSRNGTQLMASDNPYLTVTMTASIQLTQEAQDANVATNMYNNRARSTIYQTFLMTYDMLKTATGSSELGFVPDAAVTIDPVQYKYIAGTEYNDASASNVPGVTSSNYHFIDNYSYIEAANNMNLISYLADENNDYGVTLRTKFNLVYAPTDLAYQFPKKGEGVQYDIGTKVIGYSGISSSAETAAYSSNMKPVPDGNRYYTNDDNNATLVYTVVETEDNIAGPYSYLGINPIDLESENTVSFVDTVATYDTRSLKNVGNFVELTFELSNKSNYSDYLNISNYLQDIKIYGLNSSGAETVLYKSDSNLTDAQQTVTSDGLAAAEDESNVVVKVDTSDNSKIVLKVRKDYLQKRADDYFVFPIEYNVKTGNTLFNNNTGGRMYSNYMVTLTAYTYTSMSSNSAQSVSYATDHLIYTNARVISDVFEN